MDEKADTPERIEISSEGLELSGELWEPSGVRDRSPLVVLVHGIPLSAPDPDDPGYTALARELAEHGYAALFVNMRGTGESSGNFHIGGWYADLKAVMSFARDFERRFLVGFSAGGVLSIKYAALVGDVDGVAAFAAPARLQDVFPRSHVMSFIEVAREVGIIRDLEFPPSPDWFYDQFEGNEAIDFVASVSPVPLLMVHGEEDELVPLEQARRLFEAAGEPKELVVLEGGEHRLRRDPRVMPLLLDWLGSLTVRD